MSVKEIISVGLSIPGFGRYYHNFNSDQSLLDADIIIFLPDITSYLDHHQKYQGKPRLDEHKSFNLKEKSDHWRKELMTAFNSGKTIIIYLPSLKKIFIDTGERTYSGTGKSRVDIPQFIPYDNYASIPINLGNITASKGKVIKQFGDLEVLAPYWKEFSSISKYHVYFEGELEKPLLTTNSKDKAVGAIIEGNGGAIILLPTLEYDEESFTYYNDEEDDYYWNKEGIKFGEKLVSCFIEIDESLKQEQSATPKPDWVNNNEFKLKSETKYKHKLNSINSSINKLTSQRLSISTELSKEGIIRNLLFEKGKPLELAILEAISLLDLKAENFQEGDSEFDAIFTSNGKRFLCEAEGKDNKAINIDKISQLERNISEDFERDEVTEHAHGILFGNAFRLSPLNERNEFFTQKVLTSVKRSGIALVRTPDLFPIAKYLKDNTDKVFAKKCRKALSKASGEIVKFPAIPKTMKRQSK